MTELMAKTKHPPLPYQVVEVDDEILGLTGLATREQIRAAATRLAKIHDPKTGGDLKTYRRICSARSRAYQRLREQGALGRPAGEPKQGSEAKAKPKPEPKLTPEQRAELEAELALVEPLKYRPKLERPARFKRR